MCLDQVSGKYICDFAGIVERDIQEEFWAGPLGNSQHLLPNRIAVCDAKSRIGFGNIFCTMVTHHSFQSSHTRHDTLGASAESGEKMWQLPMDQEYKAQNQSNVADIKNTGGAGAGSITAAHFIGEFAKDISWVHLDIAGMAMTDRERGLHVKGATGIPVRSLVKLALNLASHPSP